MKWITTIVLVSAGVIGCSRELPPVKAEMPTSVSVDIITDVTPQITEVQPDIQRKRKAKPARKKALAGVPTCEKSVMPGYSGGKALDAAVDGFNARGEDIDKCNEAIELWARQLLGSR